MPLAFDKKLNSQNWLLLWKIEEDISFFEEKCNLTDLSQHKYDNFKSIRRKKEFLATRLLLNHIGLSDANLKYESDGSPYLIDSDFSFISISHNKEYASILLGNKKVGVDIEMQSNKLSKIKDKFLSNEEQATFDHASVECLSLLWSAKEALFKYAHFNGIDLKKQLLIDEIRQNDNLLKCRIIDKDQNQLKLDARFENFGENVLVYIV
jgi:4'-phosphopantetheinyl transferase